MSAARSTNRLIGADCDVGFDLLTRRLYATDASQYQLLPEAVAFPRGARQAASLIRTAADAGIPVTPRGAGTGLTGGAVGGGVILDLARHNRSIFDFNPEQRTVRVGAGVVLDQLNAYLGVHGLCFGPDVATSSRATLGGMIANNSSGAHAPYYGTTIDHVVELELVLADGRIARTAPGDTALDTQRQTIARLVRRHAREIAARRPPGLRKRWPAFAVERCLEEPENLNPIICGSEGTLAAIASAELRVVPRPRGRGLVLLFFASVPDAMQATVELLDLNPAAIEHVDRPLLDQTRGQVKFKAARDLLDLDARPCESILAVEFFEEIEDRIAAVLRRRLTPRHLVLREPGPAALFWGVRKAGLALLTGRAGDAKPVTLIEDAAVLPKKLPAYVAALRGILDRRGLEASFYGHAASGLLHVRPVLNLHTPEGLRTFRELATEVAALVAEFKGSLAAEHGVGTAHTEFIREQLGEELFEVMREIKQSFDPRNLFNPGKIIADGSLAVDRNLRISGRPAPELPFDPVLAFRAKDGSFIRNLEQCNGCGTCIKATPTMCPTFIATGDEGMSTRGRANLIRGALEGQGVGSGFRPDATEIEYALSNCLSCRACATECPSNVNLSLLKAELQHARIRRDGLTFRERLFSEVDLLGRIGCAFPSLSNWLLASPRFGGRLAGWLGMARQRRLPPYTRDRFDRWFRRRSVSPKTASRGKVLLWDDTFVRYHEPEIGFAAVKILEEAGYAVELVAGRRCCGRPAFSQGNLGAAMKLGTHNVALLGAGSAPIIFLEPSCWSMFAEDYAELGIPGAQHVASRSVLFEQFIGDLLDREPEALRFAAGSGTVAIHAHCHAKSMLATEFMVRLAARLPGRKATLLDTGCCGMAGGFGMLATKYGLSVQVAEPLVERLRQLPPDSVCVASGTSCRHQIAELGERRARHPAELLASALIARAPS